MTEETRTYWLSFCDSDRPRGQQFLGVCIVDVNTEEATEAFIDVALRFPRAQEGSEWIAAAVGKAHREKCNPGGEVATVDITGMESPVPLVKNVLLSRDDLERLGLQPISQGELEDAAADPA